MHQGSLIILQLSKLLWLVSIACIFYFPKKVTIPFMESFLFAFSLALLAILRGKIYNQFWQKVSFQAQLTVANFFMQNVWNREYAKRKASSYFIHLPYQKGNVFFELKKVILPKYHTQSETSKLKTSKARRIPKIESEIEFPKIDDSKGQCISSI